MKNPLYAYGLSRAEWEALINQSVFNEKDRRLLIYRFLDGHTLEESAEYIGMSVEQTKRRKTAALEILLKAAEKVAKVIEK